MPWLPAPCVKALASPANSARSEAGRCRPSTAATTASLASCSPTPGAPYTYVTTKQFLIAFGIETLRDLPDIEALEDAGCSVETACRRKRRQVRLRRTRNSGASRSGRHPLVNFRSYICSSTLADFYRIVYQ